MLKCTVADPSVWLDMQYFHQGEWDQLRVSSTARYCVVLGMVVYAMCLTFWFCFL